MPFTSLLLCTFKLETTSNHACNNSLILIWTKGTGQEDLVYLAHTRSKMLPVFLTLRNSHFILMKLILIGFGYPNISRQYPIQNSPDRLLLLRKGTVQKASNYEFVLITAIKE